MFEKQRESLEASKNYQKAKLHVQAHKMAYACLGSAAVSGSVVTLLKSRPLNVTNVTNVMPKIAPVMTNIVNNTAINAGPCCKVVQDVETQKLWPMIQNLVNELAEEHDRDPEAVRRMLSRHFAGKLENVFGHRYKRIATRTTH